jgi:hypothetical protein
VSDVSLETPLDRLTTYITPNDDFFVRHHAPTEPPDPAAWSLTVDGEVGRPLRLSLEELKHSRSPARRTSQKSRCPTTTDRLGRRRTSIPDTTRTRGGSGRSNGRRGGPAGSA